MCSSRVLIGVDLPLFGIQQYFTGLGAPWKHLSWARNSLVRHQPWVTSYVSWYVVCLEVLVPRWAPWHQACSDLHGYIVVQHLEDHPPRCQSLPGRLVGKLRSPYQPSQCLPHH